MKKDTRTARNQTLNGSACDRFNLVAKSKNKKTGPMPVSMSTMATCPPACKLRGVCYAAYGPLNFTWRRLSEGSIASAHSWDSFLEAIKAMSREVKVWRHNQTGDLPGEDNKLDRDRCYELAQANKHGRRSRGGFTYTHYPMLEDDDVSPRKAASNRNVVAMMNERGFTVNLSADNLEHADKLAELGIGPVVTILPQDASGVIRTPEGRRVVLCPAITKDDVSCHTCKICQKSKRKSIIGFPAHGVKKRAASEIAAGG